MRATRQARATVVPQAESGGGSASPAESDSRAIQLANSNPGPALSALPTLQAPAAVSSLIAIGGNLGDAQATVAQAMQDVGVLPQTQLLCQSSLYRTAPVDSTGPDYINAVIEISTRLAPHALLAQLQALEDAAGRARPYRNAPRTLDLDILLYGDQVLNTATLQVPHPRMMQRAFVLMPLAEIAPQRVSAEQLMAVSDQAISRVEAADSSKLGKLRQDAD